MGSKSKMLYEEGCFGQLRHNLLKRTAFKKVCKNLQQKSSKKNKIVDFPKSHLPFVPNSRNLQN